MNSHDPMPTPVRLTAMKYLLAITLLTWQGIAAAAPVASAIAADATVAATTHVSVFEILLAIGCGALIAWLLMRMFKSTGDDKAGPHHPVESDSGKHG